jgi:hypothetical protein
MNKTTLLSLVTVLVTLVVALNVSTARATAQDDVMLHDPNDTFLGPAALWDDYECQQMVCPGGFRRQANKNYYGCVPHGGNPPTSCVGTCFSCNGVGAATGWFCRKKPNNQCGVGQGRGAVNCGVEFEHDCSHIVPATAPDPLPPNGCFCVGVGTQAALTCSVQQCPF